MPRDGGSSDLMEPESQENKDSNGPRDAILVTDADNPTAEQVVLQLILCR